MMTDRVARRFRAELLTKQWLMGVRRGWLSLLHPSIHDWADVFKAFARLDTFINNLEDQVFLVRRAPLFGENNDATKKDVEEMFKKIRDALHDNSGKARHWYEVATGQHDFLGAKREEGEKMFSLYQTKFEECLDTWVKSRGTPSGGRNAQVTELLDKILETLRVEAKKLEESRKVAPDDTDNTWGDSAYKEFDLYGMKVVIDDRTVTQIQIKQYIRYLDEAYARLKAKGFEKVWYGTVFVRCKDCGGDNPYGRELGVGGNYPIGPDIVNVFSRPSPFIVELMSHELGHRYWFKFMHEAERGKFESLVRAHTRVKPHGVEGRPLPADSLQKAQTLVEVACGNLERVLLDLKTKKAWYRDVIEKESPTLQKAAHTFGDEYLNAMHSLGGDTQINPDVSRKFKECIDEMEGIHRFFFKFYDSINEAVNATPEPSEAPKSLNTYWWKIYVGVRDKWIDEGRQHIVDARGAARDYLEASFNAYNDVQDHLKEKSDKDYEDDWDKDPRQVLPVSSYGRTHIDEAFAEVFAHYILGRDLNRDQLESFRSVVSSEGAIMSVDPLILRIFNRFALAQGEGDTETKGKRNGPPPRWDEWLDAEHQGGKAMVSNPNTSSPQKQVQFNTALKDKPFMQKALADYRKWLDRNKEDKSGETKEKDEDDKPDSGASFARKGPLKDIAGQIDEMEKKHGSKIAEILNGAEKAVKKYEKGLDPAYRALFKDLPAAEKAIHVVGHEIGKYFEEEVLSHEEREMQDNYIDAWKASVSNTEAQKLQGLFAASGVSGHRAPGEDDESSVTKDREEGSKDAKLRDYVRKVYAFQQAAYKKMGLKEITQYRGARNPKLEEMKPGDDVSIKTRELSSFTSDPSVAMSFSNGGAALECKVPVDKVFQSPMTRPGFASNALPVPKGTVDFREAEYLILGGSDLSFKKMARPKRKLLIAEKAKKVVIHLDTKNEDWLCHKDKGSDKKHARIVERFLGTA